MSSEPDQTGPWERIAQELRACKESQRKAWGDIEDAALVRYLDGHAFDHERARVENALEELPELRKLTDLVRDVLNDLEPVVFDAPPEPVVSIPAPVVLPFPTKARPTRRQRFLALLRQRASFVAAACLLLICGLAMPRPGFLSAPRPGETLRLTGAVASRTFVPVAAPADGTGRVGFPTPAGFDPVLGDARGEPGRNILFARPEQKENASSSTSATLRQAVEFQRQVALAGSRGELARAVPQLQQVHLAYQRRFGRNHPATKQTARTLAGLYQVALNAAPSESGNQSAGGGARFPSRPGERLPSLTMKTASAQLDRTSNGATSASYRNALALRDQITSCSTQDVQTAVVPLLTDALQTATNSQERMDLVRAIAALGPAASNAVPVLTQRLETSDDPNEVRLVLNALNELGPAARQAVPTLVALCRECGDHAAGKMRPAAKIGKDKSSAVCRNRRLTSSEGKLAEQAVASLNSPEGRSGIDDQAGCFSVRMLNQSTRALREAARKAGVEVFFSTTCSADSTRKGSKKDGWKASRLRMMGKRAIHVLFDRQGTVVEVHVSEALRRAGVTPEKVRTCLLERVRRQQYDKALDESVKFVTNIAAKKK